MPTLATSEVLATFKGAHKIAICSHVNPDGDALGSSLALAALLRAQGHAVTCLLAQDRPAPHYYSFLKNYDFVAANAYTETPDLFIAIDLPTLKRLGDGVAVLERSPRSLCIDHHPDYTGFADEYYGDSNAAATASIIWNLIKVSGVEATQAMAEHCYVGLITDTGRFAFQNTNEQAFRDAADMVSCGVDPTIMSMKIYENKSMNVLSLEARLIDRMQFARNQSVVYSWVDENDFRELDLSKDDAEGLPSILRSIACVKIALLFRVEGEVVRVNLRSRDDYDVGALARLFNGGGHRAAAGLTYEGTLDDAFAQVLAALGDCKSPCTDKPLCDGASLNELR